MWYGWHTQCTSITIAMGSVCSLCVMVVKPYVPIPRKYRAGRATRIDDIGICYVWRAQLTSTDTNPIKYVPGGHIGFHFVVIRYGWHTKWTSRTPDLTIAEQSGQWVSVCSIYCLPDTPFGLSCRPPRPRSQHRRARLSYRSSTQLCQKTSGRRLSARAAVAAPVHFDTFGPFRRVAPAASGLLPCAGRALCAARIFGYCGGAGAAATAGPGRRFAAFGGPNAANVRPHGWEAPVTPTQQRRWTWGGRLATWIWMATEPAPPSRPLLGLKMGRW